MRVATTQWSDVTRAAAVRHEMRLQNWLSLDDEKKVLVHGTGLVAAADGFIG
jgi:hypothetical protein